MFPRMLFFVFVGKDIRQRCEDSPTVRRYRDRNQRTFLENASLRSILRRCSRQTLKDTDKPVEVDKLETEFFRKFTV